jgi:hypothetical protein
MTIVREIEGVGDAIDKRGRRPNSSADLAPAPWFCPTGRQNIASSLI